MSDHLASYRALCAAKKPKALDAGLRYTPELNGSLFPHQEHGVAFALRAGRAALFYDTGLGKQQPVSEPVLTPRGWATMGSLRPGDFVIGRDGLPTEVLGVFPQGVQRVWRVELSDGTFVRAGSEHLWAVRTKVHRYRGQPFSVLTTEQIAASIHRDWQLPLFDPADTDDVILPIDPYALGVLLGDGTLGKSVSICTDDWIGEALGWRRTAGHKTCSYVGYWDAPKQIADRLSAIGLRGCVSHEKSVPGAYIHLASPAQRLALLQGLMDTDGHAMPDGGAEFSSTSLNLIETVESLARSLGGVARGRRQAAATYEYQGETREGKPAWRVNLKLPPGRSMFRLPRKAAIYVQPTKYQPARLIREVIDEGVTEDQVCIKVAARDSLYVTRDYVVTHNTAMMLEWGRVVVEHTNKPVLMLAPLAVGAQHLREAERLDIDAVQARFGLLSRDPRVVITNYERLDKFDPADFGGVILDESSILKSFTGVTTRKLIAAFANTPFRLAGTATPAPNDHTELGQHSSFLGVMPSNEMLSRFFINDQSLMGRYRLKKPAIAPFWDWVASWARCVSKPSDLGFSDDGFVLPELKIERHIVETDRSINTGEEKDGQYRLFRIPDRSATAIHAEKRLTIEDRAGVVGDLVGRHRGEPICIWVDTDYEADAIRALDLPGLKEVRGSHTPDRKEETLDAFSKGELPILITKPSIAGFGLNWQHCHTTIFAGVSFSYESFYQAVRRFWRFGQKSPVTAHIVCADTELEIAAAVSRKSEDHERMKREMAAAMARAAHSHEILDPYQPIKPARLPSWVM